MNIAEENFLSKNIKDYYVILELIMVRNIWVEIFNPLRG